MPRLSKGGLVFGAMIKHGSCSIYFPGGIIFLQFLSTLWWTNILEWLHLKWVDVFPVENGGYSSNRYVSLLEGTGTHQPHSLPFPFPLGSHQHSIQPSNHPGHLGATPPCRRKCHGEPSIGGHWGAQKRHAMLIAQGWFPPSRKLTYPLKIDDWKMKFPFKMVPFQGTC